MSEQTVIRWHGYSREDIYSAQDDCLLNIRAGLTLKIKDLQRIPPHRAALLSSIAEKANTGLERGTNKQLQAEAKAVGGNGKLGDWWLREI
jgi:hypothetical protein